MSRRGGLRDIATVLRLPHYGPFLLARTASAVGVWMERLATGWLVWELTQSTAWLGVVAFLRLAPALFLGLLGGAWSDRTRPTRVLLLGKIAIVAVKLTMLAILLAGALTVELLAAVALAIGALQAVSNPAAAALVWDLVPRKQLGTAISVGALSLHTATFVGPALAGLVAAVSGFAPVYALAAAGQVALIWVLLRMPSELQTDAAEKRARGDSLWTDMMAGARYIREDRAVFAILAIHFVFAVSAQPLIDLMPAIAALFFNGGAVTVSMMTASLGAGALIGGVWLAAFSPKGALKSVVGCALLILMALIIVLAVNRNLPVALGLLAGIGACLVIRASGLQTLLQLTVSDEMRGRAMGFYGLLIRGGSAIGALAIGFAAESIGLSWAIAVAAMAGATTLVIVAKRHRVSLTRVKVK